MKAGPFTLIDSRRVIYTCRQIFAPKRRAQWCDLPARRFVGFNSCPIALHCIRPLLPIFYSSLHVTAVMKLPEVLLTLCMGAVIILNVDAVPKHRTGPRLDVPYPRLTVEQLRASPEYLRGAKPFILVGAVDAWKAHGKWTQKYLLRKFGDQIVDFYPWNLQFPPAKVCLRACDPISLAAQCSSVCMEGDLSLAYALIQSTGIF